MENLHLGDDVIVNGQQDGLPILNRTGIIYAISKQHGYLVRFDEKFNSHLHNGAIFPEIDIIYYGQDDLNYRCWWCCENIVTLNNQMNRYVISGL
jgi:hypothetical protein